MSLVLTQLIFQHLNDQAINNPRNYAFKKTNAMFVYRCMPIHKNDVFYYFGNIRNDIKSTNLLIFVLNLMTVL